MQGTSPQGFFEALFDFSFSSFVAERVIPILYVLSIVVLGLAALFIIIAGFAANIAAGILALIIIAPLYFVIAVIYVRVVLELLLAVFRIADSVREIAEQGRRQPPPSAP